MSQYLIINGMDEIVDETDHEAAAVEIARQYAYDNDRSYRVALVLGTARSVSSVSYEKEGDE